MEYDDLRIEGHEIEAHFAANNRLHQECSFTLDDLNFYAEPLGAVVLAVRMASGGIISREEAREVMNRAIDRYRALDAALEAKYDGENI